MDVSPFYTPGTEEKTLLHRIAGNLDWLFITALVFLIGIGLVTVYSATLHYGNAGRFIVTQTAAVLIGLLGMIILTSFNYQYYRQFMYVVYAASVILLISVLIGGKTIRGTKGWFSLGVFSFQPVELAKIAFILVFSGFLDSRWREVKRLSTLLLALGIMFGHLALIMLQPDFSSTLSYFPVALALLFVAGVEPVYLLGIFLFGLLSAGIPLMATFFKLQPDLMAAHPLLKFFVAASKGGMHAFLIVAGIVAALFALWYLSNKLFSRIPVIYPVALSLILVLGSVGSLAVQKSLKDYQRKRLIVFLNPDIDPLNSGYNIIQSKIAIGSGRLLGKGLFQGSQSQLGFLPEQHTDFIFSVIGEETGYFISQLAIAFYFILVWRALLVARDARDRYGSLVATGVATLFAFYAVINIGMVMGVMPAAGLPLALISYGGSSMVSSLWALGILMSVQVRRFTN